MTDKIFIEPVGENGNQSVWYRFDATVKLSRIE